MIIYVSSILSPLIFLMILVLILNRISFSKSKLGLDSEEYLEKKRNIKIKYAEKLKGTERNFYKQKRKQEIIKLAKKYRG